MATGTISSDMYPRLAAHDLANSFMGDAERSTYGSHRLAREPSNPDVADIVFCEARLADLLPSRYPAMGGISQRWMPTLGPHVAGVVPRVSKEEMVRVYAGRSIATVQYPGALRHRSDVNDPGGSMSEHNAALLVFDLPVTVRAEPRPDPALHLAEINSPESLDEPRSERSLARSHPTIIGQGGQ
jgi:hypothetical protein